MPGPVPTSHATPPRLLVVEDDSTTVAAHFRGRPGAEARARGEDALKLLERERFDVVVAVLPLFDMGAAEFFERARPDPRAVRLAVSDSPCPEAHLVLPTAVAPGELDSAIRHVLACRAVYTSEKLGPALSKVESLQPPALYLELMEELRRDNVSLARIGRLVAQDVGLSSKVLTYVNSAYFGLAQRVEDAEHAISMIGINTLRSLLMQTRFMAMASRSQAAGATADRLWSHHLHVATAAKRVAAAYPHAAVPPESAFLASFLHDCGRIVLAAEFPNLYSRVFSLAKTDNLSVVEAELKLFGTTHAEVAGFLLYRWGLPEAVVDAVVYHHDPASCPDQDFNVLTVVHASEYVVAELMGPDAELEAPVDNEYLEAHACIDVLDRVLAAAPSGDWADGLR